MYVRGAAGNYRPYLGQSADAKASFASSKNGGLSSGPRVTIFMAAASSTSFLLKLLSRPVQGLAL